MAEDTNDKDEIKRLEKRIDDLKDTLKWILSIFTLSIGLLIGGLSAFSGFNLKSEREALKDFRESVKAEVREILGKSSTLPEVSLRNLNGKPLHGGVVMAGAYAVWVNGQYKRQLRFPVVLDNIGKSSSGALCMKIYASDPLHLEHANTDANGFQYQTFLSPERLDHGELPAGVSLPFEISSFLGAGKLRHGQYEIRLKAFYGNGRFTEATFNLDLSEGDEFGG